MRPLHKMDIPYEDDEEAQAFVSANPDGASLADIAKHLGMPEFAARDIVISSLNKLRRAEGLPVATSTGAMVKQTDDVDTSMWHAASPDEPLPEELYSPEGLRLAQLVRELEAQVEEVEASLWFCAASSDGQVSR